MKIMVLCTGEPHHKYLISKLNENFNVDTVIIELSKKQRINLLKRKKYTDYFYSVYHKLRRDIVGSNRYRANYFKIKNDKEIEKKALLTNSINSCEVKETIKKVNPDITIVMGTSIIKKSVLNLLNGNVINIHGGLLPFYKGNHCIFFAVYNGELDKVGCTIHFINEGIDLGDIIKIVKPEIYSNDNPEKLYCRAEKKAIEELINILHNYKKGIELKGIPQEKRGKLYYTRDRKFYHEFIFFFKNLKKKCF